MAQQSGDDGTRTEETQQRARLGGGAIASLSGVAVLAIFMAQNTEDVTVKFLAWEFTWPVWLLTLVSALVVAFVWLGLGVLRRHRRLVRVLVQPRDLRVEHRGGPEHLQAAVPAAGREEPQAHEPANAGVLLQGPRMTEISRLTTRVRGGGPGRPLAFDGVYAAATRR